MKKIVILAIAAISLSSANVIASNNSNLIAASTANPVEKSTGTIVELTETGGKLMDHATGEIRSFDKIKPGAQIEFVIGDSVSYRLITLPNGKPPVVIDVKKPM